MRISKKLNQDYLYSAKNMQHPCGGLCPHEDSLNCFTSALTNSIALAGSLSLSIPFGSGRVGVVEDDNDLTDLKYF